MLSQLQTILPPPTISLATIFNELHSIGNERLDQKLPSTNEEIKGLKFISNRLAKLFDKNKKLPYHQITKILIDNFAVEPSDQRNIKRRVYDAINVMVAAGIFQKKGDFIERQHLELKKIKQDPNFLEEKIKESSSNVQKKKEIIKQLKQKISKAMWLFERNRKKSIKSHVIMSPLMITYLNGKKIDYELKNEGQRIYQLKVVESKSSELNRGLKLIVEETGDHLSYL